MKNHFHILAFSLMAAFLAIPSTAFSINYSWSSLADFNGIDNFNLFLTGNLEYYKSDVEGRIAVKGDVKLNNFSLGLKASKSEYSLIAGGDIKAGGINDSDGGQVNNGGVYSSGKIDLKRVGLPNGDVVAKGEIYMEQLTVERGDVKTASDTITIKQGAVPNGEIKTTVCIEPPLDFDAFSLEKLSSELYREGTKLALDDENKLVAECMDPAICYFDALSSDLQSAWGFLIKGAPDATVIVNVDSTPQDSKKLLIASMDFRLLGGIRSSNILYNFHGIDSITMHHVGLKGSILASNADINFYEGVMEGNLMAHNLFGGSDSENLHGGQINMVPVPEPSTWQMVLLGILFIGFIGLSLRPYKN